MVPASPAGDDASVPAGMGGPIMSRPEDNGVSEQQLRALRIVIVAQMAGSLFFAGIDIVLWAQGMVPFVPNNVPMVSYVAVGFAIVILSARFVLMRVTDAAARKQLLAAPKVTTKQVVDRYGGRMMTGAALLNGGAFFFLIAYLLEGQPWTLAGGLAFALLIGLVHFPTRQRVEDWVAATRAAVEQERLGK
jgi:hypothetical protein